jgi:hypothetical protein
MSNGYGSWRMTPESDLAAYDRSPPLLRQAQAYAVAKWAAEPQLRDYHKLVREMGYSPQSACQLIMQTMAKAERKDTLKDYGPTHPEAYPAQARARA